MANQGRKRFALETLGEGRLHMSGRFFPDGTTNPDAAKCVGTTGWTVAYTSTGLWTITMDDVWQYIMGKECSLTQATIGDQIVRFGAEVLASRTVKIGCWDISSNALADLPAYDANTFIDFSWTLKRSANSGKR